MADSQLDQGVLGAHDESAVVPWHARRKTLLLALVAAGVSLVRLYYCTRIPINTGDALRHIFHGLYVLRSGLGSAAVPLATLNPGLANVVFAPFPYNYPPVTLGFFTALTAIYPTVFAIKVALTAIEGINGWLIAKLTDRPLLGILYWASPISIWSVSLEGQFEPLQGLFMLVALLALRTNPAIACALLVLGVQVKLTAIFLVPWFALVVFRAGPEAVKRSLLASALAMLPSVAASMYYPVLRGIGSTFGMMRYNPYFWNVADRGMFLWNPTWLIAINFLTSTAVLAALAWHAKRSREPVSYLGAFAFILSIKLSALGQFWYMLLFPAFAAAIPDRGVRFWLIVLTPLLDVYGVLQLLTGPFGFLIGDYWSGITAFTVFRLR